MQPRDILIRELRKHVACEPFGDDVTLVCPFGTTCGGIEGDIPTCILNIPTMSGVCRSCDKKAPLSTFLEKIGIDPVLMLEARDEAQPMNLTDNIVPAAQKPINVDLIVPNANQSKSKKSIENKADEKSIRYVVSEVLPSGEIIELVYRENYGQTMLAIFDGVTVRYEDKFERPNEILLPCPA